MVPPNEFKPIIPQLSTDRLYWEEVKEARNRRIEEKLLAGPRLFDQACQRVRERIRAHFPGIDPKAEDAILERLLEMCDRD